MKQSGINYDEIIKEANANMSLEGYEVEKRHNEIAMEFITGKKTKEELIERILEDAKINKIQ